MVIGITGGLGAGKSTLTNELNKKKNNSMIINVDDFMHKFLDIHKDEIIIINSKKYKNISYNKLQGRFQYGFKRRIKKIKK